jgi:hypothetical protein
MRISTLSPRSWWLHGAPDHNRANLSLALDRCIESIRDQVQECAGDFLRKHIDRAGRLVKIRCRVILNSRFSARAPW